MTFVRKDIPDSIAFELSNRCNYAKLHPECPTKAGTDPIFLDAQIVKDALDYLGQEKYSGTIYFNIYNEPLIDPRLFMLLEYNKEHCGAGVCIYTNGWGLNQYIADELGKLGAAVMMSCYTTEDHERGLTYVSVCASKIKLHPDVIHIYDSPEIRKGICRFPSVYGVINCKGEYALCCRDFEYRHIIGDLKKNSLEEVLKSDYRKEVCDRLEAGDRFLETCRRCPFPGWGV